MVRCGSKNKYQKDTCLKKVGLHAQKYDDHSRLSGQHNSGEPIVYNHLLSTRIFALRMSEVFIHALERTRKVDVALIWIP